MYPWGFLIIALIVGAALYLGTETKVAELGRLTFAGSMFAICFRVAQFITDRLG
jgi:hypothetical protein